MDGQISGKRTIDMLQELAKLKGPMARPAFADYRPGGDLQSSEQRKDLPLSTGSRLLALNVYS